eukprot:9645145-Ditylum_brightwellii.AAC.1
MKEHKLIAKLAQLKTELKAKQEMIVQQTKRITVLKLDNALLQAEQNDSTRETHGDMQDSQGTRGEEIPKGDMQELQRILD